MPPSRTCRVCHSLLCLSLPVGRQVDSPSAHLQVQNPFVECTRAERTDYLSVGGLLGVLAGGACVYRALVLSFMCKEHLQRRLSGRSPCCAHPEGLFPTRLRLLSYPYLSPGAFVRPSSDLRAQQPAGLDREGLLAVTWTRVSGKGSLIRERRKMSLGCGWLGQHR